MVSIIFDNGVSGGSLTAIGDDPIYHHRNQVVYGAPSVEDLSAVYPSSKSIRVLQTCRWDGIDIVPMINSTDLEVDIWFGDPTDGGTRVTLDVDAGAGAMDLKIDSPVSGYRFLPQRFLVAGDTLIAFCTAIEVATSRRNKVGILYASMSDIQSETADPWEVAFVTNEYSSAANNIGSAWAIMEVQEFEGSYWSIACDYDSDQKEGGQCWIIEMDSSGVPVGMVRLHARSGQTAEHWHGGCILYDGVEYTAIWHHGDGDKRLMYRTISSLSNYADNATVDTGSGVGGSYRVKNVSESDWSAIGIAAGPDESTTLTNSEWRNAFIICPDPNDASKFLSGGDVAGGLIERISLDSNKIAICETVFNPRSRVAQQEGPSSSQQLSTFYTTRNGDHLACPVSNELDEGSPVPQYTGVIASDDGGASWGWIWKGTPTRGTTQNNGLAVLSSGKVLVGALNSGENVLAITRGAKIEGKPAFVGYRHPNLLGSATDQAILNDGGGAVTSLGSSPQKPLPSYLHGEEVFRIHSSESGGAPNIEFVNLGITEATLKASNMLAAFWVRRRTPSSADEDQRMAIDTRLGWNSPGGNYGSSNNRYTPPPKTAADDWTRIVGIFDGSNLTGTFTNDPSDLRANVRQLAVGKSDNDIELFMDAICVDVDRVPLPYGSRSDSGIASGKVTGLSLGSAWSVLAVMQIPEECWDSWSANEDGEWDDAAPVLSISDGVNSIEIGGKIDVVATGGAGTPHTDADFHWDITDSDSATPTEIADHPLRTVPVVIAVSKDAAGDIQYAIGGPNGVVSGTRAMASAISPTDIRFSDAGESDALEMYAHKVDVLPQALDAEYLATAASNLGFGEAPTLASSDPADGETGVAASAKSVDFAMTDLVQTSGEGVGTITGGGLPETFDHTDVTINASERNKFTLMVNLSEASGTPQITFPAGFFTSLTNGLPSEEFTVAFTVVGAVLEAQYGGNGIVSGGTIDLGEAEQHSSHLAIITLENTGYADLTLGTITVSGRLSIVAGYDPSGTTLAAGETATLTVAVDSGTLGAVTGAVSVPSDDSGSPWVATLEAVIVAADASSMRSAYLTVSECTAILHEMLLGADLLRRAWDSLDTDDQVKCVTNASIDFDTVRWDGAVAVDGQAMMWPRIDEHGEIILPNGELLIPDSLGTEEWSYTNLPAAIRIGVALQAAARAAAALRVDTTQEVLGKAAAGITGIAGAGLSQSAEAHIARQPSSVLHWTVLKIVRPFIANSVEVL